MTWAWFFEDFEDLAGFAKAVKPGAATFRLCRVAHPEKPRALGYLLLSPQKRVNPAYPPVSVEETANVLRWKGFESAILEEARGNSLLELIQLRPWKAAQFNGHVIFRTASPDALANLLRDSIRLGNDRLQYAQVDGPLYFARVEKPSHYLIQRCLEDSSLDFTLFRPVAEDLYVEWGYEHPLAELWLQSEKARSNGWVFFRHPLEREHLAPLRWLDVYDLAEFELDFPSETLVAQSAGSPRRFQVQLRLYPKSLNLPEPELWLLDDRGVRELEGLLHLDDEEQFRPFQVAIVRAENGPDRFFLREKRAGQERRRLSLSGRGFASFKGLSQLFLPVDRELLPPLRRDVYRGLFTLSAGTLTVLNDGEEGPFEILKMQERSFQPLSSMIDYLVERDAAILEERMRSSIFDLGEFVKSPSNPNLRPPAREEGGRSKEAAAEPATSASENPTVSGTEAEGPEMFPLLNADRIDESTLEEAERTELRLEREVIVEQSAERWLELAACKRRLGRIEESLISAIEGLWLSQTGAQEQSARALIQRVAEELGAPPGVEPADGEFGAALQRGALFRDILSAPTRDALPEETDAWVARLSLVLQRHGSQFRCKERWLAWREVLLRNHDDRRAAQLREGIRRPILENGLPPDEAPGFIRQRIFHDRGARLGGDDEGAQEVLMALNNLHGMEEVARKCSHILLRSTLRAVLARAHNQLGYTNNAIAMVEGHPAPKSNLGAWALLFQAQALEREAPAIGVPLREEFQRQSRTLLAETRKAMAELDDLHRKRSEIENPAQFLAMENRRRSYPSGPAHETGPLAGLIAQLRRQHSDGNEPAAVQTMRRMLSLDDVKNYDDHVKLPQFVEAVVAGIARFQWGERGAALAPSFEHFARRAPGYVRNIDPFYGALLHSQLALGMVAIGNSQRAEAEIEKAVSWVGKSRVELDFIDSAAGVLAALESLPVERRRNSLTQLLEMTRQWLDPGKSHLMEKEHLFTAVARLLEQFAEAAISRDRLTLDRFRTYLLQDEFLILQRIQHETFA